MDQQLLDRAKARGGVFSARDLTDLGITKTQLDQCLASGEAIRLMTGGYGLPLLEPDPWGLGKHLQLVRVALLLEPRAAAAHLSALVAHGIDLLGARLDVVHLSRPGPQVTSHRPTLTRHRMPAQAQMVGTPHGVRAVDPVSALIQYAADATFEQAVSAVDSALHQDLVLPQLITQRIPQLPRKSGPAKLARIVAASDRWAESVGETRTRLFLVSRGFQPFSQVPIIERGHKFAQVDFQIVGTRVVVEFDGLGKYDQPGALVAEKRREDRIRAAGYHTVRLEWSDLAEPEAFLRRLNDALRADRTASSRERIGPCRYPERHRVRDPHVCLAPHPPLR